HAVDPTYRTLLRRLAIASVVNCNHRIGCAHGEHRVIAMGEMALEQHLLEITQRGRHRLHPLAEFNEELLDKPLAEAGLEQPRQEVPHVPAVKSDLRNVVVLE